MSAMRSARSRRPSPIVGAHEATICAPSRTRGAHRYQARAGAIAGTASRARRGRHQGRGHPMTSWSSPTSEATARRRGIFRNSATDPRRRSRARCVPRVRTRRERRPGGVEHDIALRRPLFQAAGMGPRPRSGTAKAAPAPRRRRRSTTQAPPVPVPRIIGDPFLAHAARSRPTRHSSRRAPPESSPPLPPTRGRSAILPQASTAEMSRRADLVMSACSTRARRRHARPPPSARAIAEEMPPPHRARRSSHRITNGNPAHASQGIGAEARHEVVSSPGRGLRHRHRTSARTTAAAWERSSYSTAVRGAAASDRGRGRVAWLQFAAATLPGRSRSCVLAATRLLLRVCDS